MGRAFEFENIDTLGERLKLMRVLCQLTQNELSAFLGMPQGTLTKIERNVYTPADEIIGRISKFFNLQDPYLPYNRVVPIFKKRFVFGDLLISNRNKKFQNLLSRNSLQKVILHLAGPGTANNINLLYESYGGVLAFIVFVSGRLDPPHCITVRTNIVTLENFQSAIREEHLHYGEVNLIHDFDLGVINEFYLRSAPAEILNAFRDRLGGGSLPPGLACFSSIEADEIQTPYTIRLQDESCLLEQNAEVPRNQRIRDPGRHVDLYRRSVIMRHRELDFEERVSEIYNFCKKIGAEEKDLEAALKKLRNHTSQ